MKWFARTYAQSYISRSVIISVPFIVHHNAKLNNGVKVSKRVSQKLMTPSMTPSLSTQRVRPLIIQQMTSTAAAFCDTASLLQGKFRGNGVAYFHGTQVPYVEELSLVILRKNPKMVVYRLQQDTRHATISDKPMHLEVGVLKILSSENQQLPAEAGITHPFPKGTVTELAKGTLDTATNTLVLESTGFQRINENDDKKVTFLKRVYRRQGSKLTFDQYLGVNDEEPTHHLHCELELQE